MANPGNSKSMGVTSALGRMLRRKKDEAKGAMSALSDIWRKRRGPQNNSKREKAK